MPHWKPFLEIFIMTIFVYPLIDVTFGTRSTHLIKGVVFILIVFFLADKLDLEIIHWVLRKFFGFSVMVFLILFQPELRKALSDIGQRQLLINKQGGDGSIQVIIRAISVLAKKKIGALIVLERAVGLNDYINKGVEIDALLTEGLLISLFMPVSPLHDGAIIVRKGRVLAASCLLPLTDNPTRLPLGTRHRAAIGLSEESDAIILVVSEETGAVSAVKEGKITRDLNLEDLEAVLEKEC